LLAPAALGRHRSLGAILGRRKRLLRLLPRRLLGAPVRLLDGQLLRQPIAVLRPRLLRRGLGLELLGLGLPGRPFRRQRLRRVVARGRRSQIGRASCRERVS
jgi:hypothetical protein